MKHICTSPGASTQIESWSSQGYGLSGHCLCKETHGICASSRRIERELPRKECLDSAPLPSPFSALHKCVVAHIKEQCAHQLLGIHLLRIQGLSQERVVAGCWVGTWHAMRTTEIDFKAIHSYFFTPPNNLLPGIFRVLLHNGCNENSARMRLVKPTLSMSLEALICMESTPLACAGLHESCRLGVAHHICLHACQPYKIICEAV